MISYSPIWMLRGIYKINLFLSVVLLQLFIPSAQSEVCNRTLLTYNTSSMILYQQAYRAYSYSYRCGFWNWSRCRSTRYATFRQSLIGYHRVILYSNILECCSGYVGTPPDCQAQCTGGCQNGGTCTLPDVCTCAPGWNGVNCETDIDECNGDHVCDHNCTNMDGSYMCSCDLGYELQSDGRTCKDVNECLDGNGGCPQICDNTDGSYQCSCQYGYEWDNDNLTCIDISECLNGDHNCSQLCVELDGGYECDCTDGYYLEDDGVICKDTDECSDSNGGCQHNCTNIIGGYYCTCSVGYSLDDDDHSCSDIGVKSSGIISDVTKATPPSITNEPNKNDHDYIVHSIVITVAVIVAIVLCAIGLIALVIPISCILWKKVRVDNHHPFNEGQLQDNPVYSNPGTYDEDDHDRSSPPPYEP